MTDPQQIGPYKVLRRLGCGGMGAVYLCQHRDLGFRRAIKVLHTDGSESALDRFKKEAQVQAELDHPHLLKIEHSDLDQDGRPYVVMAYVGDDDGPMDLHRYLKDHGAKLDSRTTARLVGQILDGLSYAHDEGVVHRDLKPANVLIEQTPSGPMARIADFGLVRIVGEAMFRDRIFTSISESLSLGSAPTIPGAAGDMDVKSGRDTSIGSAPTIDGQAGSDMPDEGGSPAGTSTQALIGTWSYMAPEQKKPGTTVDHRTDLYAVGLMAYRMLMGRLPEGITRLPGQEDAELSPWDAWISRALEADPSRRYQEAAEARASLSAIAGHSPSRAAWWIGLAAVVVLAAVGIWAITGGGSGTPGSQVSPAPVTSPVATLPDEGQEADQLPAAVDPGQQKLARFDELLAVAKGCTSYADRTAGLAAVREALLLIPDDPEALAERERIGNMVDPAIAADREKQRTYEQLMGRARGCTTYARRELGLAAVRDALALYPDDPEALLQRDRIEAIEDPAVVKQRKRRERYERNMVTARDCTTYAQRDRGLRAVRVALALFPDDPEALDEHDRITAIEDPAVVSDGAGTVDYDEAKEEPPVPEVGATKAVRLEDGIGGRQDLAPTRTIDLGGGVTMELVLIPAGEFTMGSNNGGSGERPPHPVRISSPFYIGKYEVTQAQWRAVMGSDPSKFKGDNRPVERVSWNDIQEFCRRLSRHAGHPIRLPTEAEWEYSCRAGTTTAYSFGDSTARLSDYAWHKGNSGGVTHAVGTKQPNPWGLHDMHGNVYEWCADWLGAYPSGVQVDPVGSRNTGGSAFRGGALDIHGVSLRSAYRVIGTPDKRNCSVGFRVAAGVPEKAVSTPEVSDRLREESGRQYDPASTLTLDLGSGVTMELVLIPAGEFLMGSSNSDSDEDPLHRVRISQPFYLGKYEVTQAQWRAVMGGVPSGFTGADHPVQKVSWSDCQEFCRKLSARTGRTTRLPTEAEWEYSCRAGTTTAYSFGDSKGRLDDHAWCRGISASEIHSVGVNQPNPWGLYDLHDNVWEWCGDWYGEDYYADSPDRDPTGPDSGMYRVHRGGSGFDLASFCRCAYRSRGRPGFRGYTYGLRVVAETDVAADVTSTEEAGAGEPVATGEPAVESEEAVDYTAQTCALFSVNNDAGVPPSGHLGTLVDQALYLGLRDADLCTVVERATVAGALETAGGNKADAARHVGAELLIDGEFRFDEGMVSILVRIVDASTGNMVRQARWSGHVSGIPDHMASDIAAGLRGDTPPAESRPQNERDLFARACRDLEDGKIDAAIEACTEILDAHPRDAETLVLRGYAELRKKGWTRSARKDFERALEVDEDHTAARLGLARTMLAGDRRSAEKALPWLEDVLEDNPDNGEALVLAALVHERAQRLDRAGDYAKRATDVFPGYGHAWFVRGRVQLAQGEFAAAVVSASSATRYEPRNAEAWLLLGDAQLACEQVAAAIRSFRQGRQCDPPPAVKRKLESRLRYSE